VELLLENRSMRVRLEGHCDERGRRKYNLWLGERRAEVVRNYLLSHGVDTDRIETLSFGKERPVMPGHEESAWEKNRRVEFSLHSIDRTNAVKFDLNHDGVDDLCYVNPSLGSMWIGSCQGPQFELINIYDGRSEAHVLMSNFRQTHHFCMKHLIDVENSETVMDDLSNVRGTINMCPVEYDDAWWHPGLKRMGFCKGEALSLETVAHEFGHALIQSSKIMEVLQSGSYREYSHNVSSITSAVEESFCDVLAVLVSGEDWIVFNDYDKKGEIRRLYDPDISHVDDFDSTRDEYDNSGITSKAAWLICKEIGERKLAEIYFRSLFRSIKRFNQSYNCPYEHIGNAVLRSAEELMESGRYDITQNDIDQIRQAFITVGMIKK
jgi:hypothetical protein